MKKTLRMMGLCALAVLALAACKKNEQKDTMTFKANLPQPACDAKTHIGSGNWLMWNAGDQIKVYTADKSETTSATFTTNDADQTTANFSGTLAQSSRYYAFYPTTGVELNADGKFMLPVSATQTYVDSNFATNAFPMCATSTDGTFNFRSPYGILGIPMKGDATIGSIVLTDTTGMQLAGYYAMDANDTTFVDTGASITLDFGAGVTLNTTTATTAYFIVPAGVFTGGFNAAVKGTDGSLIKNLGTLTGNTIVAEHIRLMPETTVNNPVPTYAVSTDGATMVSNFPISYTVNGSYSITYSKDVTEVGFYWGPGADLTNKVQATVGTSFSYTLNGLVKDTDYSYQAYINEGGVEIMGSIETFHTPDAKYTVSVSATGDSLKVYFAPGNLQYKEGTGWRFAEHQYDHIGYWNPTDWVDLFGWGTWTGSVTSASYNPLNTVSDHYNPPFIYTESPYCWDDADFCQPLTNNSETGWRTLSSAEWAYLFDNHVYGWARLYIGSSVLIGYVLFPDGIGGTVAASYDAATWAALEAAGAVYLPNTSQRYGTTMDIDYRLDGYYWSSTPSGIDGAYYMYLIQHYNTATYYTWDVYGFAVRLVRPAY